VLVDVDRWVLELLQRRPIEVRFGNLQVRDHVHVFLGGVVEHLHVSPDLDGDFTDEVEESEGSEVVKLLNELLGVGVALCQERRELLGRLREVCETSALAGSLRPRADAVAAGDCEMAADRGWRARVAAADRWPGNARFRGHVASAEAWLAALRKGQRVRLVQIDTPEVFFGSECYGRAASAQTKRLLPAGVRVRLFAEPATDRVDQYGRLLRYVVRVNGSLNVNIGLVAIGAAAPYFYSGRRGRYAGLLEVLAKRAKARKLGLWGACPHTRYDPYKGVQTRP
jgi:endonuclease YncB( thermonuclease family)